MKRMKKMWKIWAMALLCLCLAACGAARSESTAAPSYMAEAPEEAAYAEEESVYDADESNGLWEGAEAKTDDVETPVDAAGEADPAKKDQKLVYTANLSIQTLEFDKTLSAIREAAGDAGAIIESETLSDSDYRWYYYEGSKSGRLYISMTIRVPSDRYDAFVSALDGTGGKVIRKSQNVRNITRSYNDQTILIQSLEVQEKRLMEMMEAAETVEDMITIEARLSEVQTQLNQAKTALAAMDTDVAYSTVNLDVEEVIKYENNETPRSFSERVSQALHGSLDNFVEFCQDAVIFLIYAAPILLLLVIIFLILRAVFRAIRGRRAARRKKKAEKAAAGAAEGTEAPAGTKET